MVLSRCLTPLAADSGTDEGLSFADAGRLAAAASDELRNEYRLHYLREGAWTWGLRAFFPQLTISASEDDRISAFGSDSFGKNYSIGVEQLIWDGGRLSLYRKTEKAELDLALNNLGRAANEIAESAVGFYRQILFYRKVKHIRENALSSLEEQKSILLKELELGLVLPLDLSAANLTIVGARIGLLSLSLDLEEAEERFTEMLKLGAMPALKEELDIYRSFPGIELSAARQLAETGNLELKAARLSLTRRQAEARSAALSWLPVIRLTGNFGVMGQNYPLSKYNWSVGLSVEFSSPWLSGRLSGLGGWDPPDEKSARIYGSMNPLPNPAESFSIKNTRLVLEIENSNYNLAFSRIGRLAEQAVKQCALLDDKRDLAVQALMLEEEKYRLAELKLELGRLTRVQLMEARLEYASSEAAAAEAALVLLEAERELEKLLGLEPGGLNALRRDV